MSVGGCSWIPVGIRHGVGVLETQDVPTVGLLAKDLKLDSLSRWLGRARWHLRSIQRPENVRNRRAWAEESNVYLGDRKRAVTKYPGKGVSQLGFDLRTTTPPPSKDVHYIAVRSEERCVRRSIVLIPYRLYPATKGTLVIAAHTVCWKVG